MSINQVKVGWRAFSSPVVSGTDTDAQAFITAASITDSTQQSAINTLVTQLKTYGIWTKLKAVYPFVGGTATTHKWNLKDPRDLDAAYRLVFNGGWVHSSTGAKPNGSNGYANTFINTALNFTSISTSNHLSIYLRENKDELSSPIGNGVNPGVYFRITPRYQNIAYNQNNVYNAYTQFSNTDSRGFWINTRQSNLVWKHLLNGEVKSTASSAISAIPNCIISLGATYNASLSAAEVYSSNEQAFASIGDGLSDAEAANFYTAVQTYQTTLGRQVGVPIVADTDAQAFLNAAVITDSTQASAITTLVTDLKSANIWTKMKALYPFVGGTSTSHKFNLKDPRDLDAAYRLVFNGGMTHSSNGVLFGGSNGYANTFLTPSTSLALGSAHMSFYSRTNTTVNCIDFGAEKTSNSSFYGVIKNSSNNSYIRINRAGSPEATTPMSNSNVFFIANRASSFSGEILYVNSTKLTLTNAGSANGMVTMPLFIGCLNDNGNPAYYTNRECAFSSIGDGLSDAEAANFYTAVQKYQTTLGRQIGVPIVADADAQAFLNAAVITDTTQANAVTTLVTDLKSANIWSKMKALYPMVGGTATAHKFNLKDPRDLDVAYRLVFNGGWVHSTSGAQPNGTTGYADTKLIPSSALNLNSTHLSVYLNTNYSSPGSTDAVDMGVEDASYTNRLFIEPSSSGNVYSINNSNGNSYINTSDSNSLGLYVNNRISSTAINLFKNNIKLINDTARTSSALSVRPLYIGAHNFVGSASYLSPRRQVFASIGDGLTDGEAAAFYTAVQKYQTTLGRQV